MSTDVLQPKKKLLNSEHMGLFAQVNDFKIHYYEEGDGSPILLIHGIGQSLYTWHKCIDQLSTQYRVIAPDLLGYGFSDKPLDHPYTIDAMVDDIIAFMDELDIKKAHFIGFSTGALCALRLAQKYPKRTNRLVLISPGGITPEMPFLIRALRSPFLSWMFQWFINAKSTLAILSEFFFDQTMIYDEMVKQYYQPLSYGDAKRVLVRNLQEYNETETMQNLREVTQQVQMLWGVDDKVHPVEMGDQFHISLASSELNLIRNCGHLVHEEKTDRFLEFVLPFLEYGLKIAQPD